AARTPPVRRGAACRAPPAARARPNRPASPPAPGRPGPRRPGPAAPPAGTCASAACPGTPGPRWWGPTPPGWPRRPPPLPPARGPRAASRPGPRRRRRSASRASGTPSPAAAGGSPRTARPAGLLRPLVPLSPVVFGHRDDGPRPGECDRLVARLVEPEDEPPVPGPERAVNLRAVTDIPAPGEQCLAQGELVAFPPGQRGRHVPARRA